jgi:hypothetical protein
MKDTLEAKAARASEAETAMFAALPLSGPKMSTSTGWQLFQKDLDRPGRVNLQNDEKGWSNRQINCATEGLLSGACFLGNGCNYSGRQFCHLSNVFVHYVTSRC